MASGATIASSGVGGTGSTLTVTSLILNGGATYLWNVTGAASDLITSTEAITFANTSTPISVQISTNGYTFINGSSFNIMTASGGFSGFATNAFTVTGSTNGLTGTWNFSTVGNNLVLNYSFSTNVWTAGSGNLSAIGITNSSNLIFAGAVGSVTNNSQVTSLSSITFSNAATGRYTFSGSALTNGSGGIVNNSTRAQTVSLPLTLGADQTFNAASGNLTVSGSIDNAGNTLTVAGAANTTISGAMSGAGGLVKNDAGTLTLSGSNTLGGDVNLEGGTTTITGSVTNGGNVYSGNVNSGVTLVVSNGTLNTAGQLIAGFNPGANNNTITVTGSNAVVIAGSGIFLGYDVNTNNSLIVSNGAMVTTAGQLVVGSATNSGGGNNQIVISGAGSRFTAQGLLTVGDSTDSNSLTVMGGGTLVTAGGTTIGTSLGSPSYAGSNNSVLITGTGSTWSNTGGLVIGDTGGGAVTVTRGGSVISTTITLGYQSNSSGTLNIGSLGSNEGAGSIMVSTIYLGAGTGTLNFNQSNTATIAASIQGSNGSINQLGGGTTVLTGVNDSFSGNTVISNGTLQIGAGGTNGSLGYGLVSISNGGTLAFNLSNTYTSQNNISGAGTLAQNGSGTLTLLGANSYGATTINGGTLQVGNGNTVGSLGTGAVALTNSGALVINRGYNVTLSN